MDEHARKLCVELEILRQAAQKMQVDQALSNNLARQAEILDQLKHLGIDPDTLETVHRDSPRAD